MLRSDLITSEIQKLAQVLARIIGLKIENPELLFEELKNAIDSNFILPLNELTSMNLDELENSFKSSNYSAEQIDMLVKFVVQLWNVKPSYEHRQLILNLIQLLEDKYQYMNFEFMQIKKTLK